MRTPEKAHRPRRPHWDCEACGADWPCPPAREAIARETGGGTALAIMMWTYLAEFALDAGSGSVAGAFERFIAWNR